MKATIPELHNDTLGEKQAEYETLPVYKKNTYARDVVAKFVLTEDEISEIVENKCLYYKQLTFNLHFHPMLISPFKEHVYTQEELQKIKEIEDEKEKEGTGVD